MIPRARVVGLVVSLAAGSVAAAVTAHVLRERRSVRVPPPLVSREVAMRAFEVERADARGRAMALAEERDVPVTAQGPRGYWSQRLEVGERECVAVIATVVGGHVPVALALQSLTEPADRIVSGSAEPITLDRADDGLVAQVQWCQLEARARRVVLETRPLSALVFERPLTGTVHYAVYRAPWQQFGGPAAIRRGAPRSWAIQQFPPELAAEEGLRAAPADGRLLGVPIPLRVDGARLVPGTADTYRALYARVRGARVEPVNPRVDSALVVGDPWESGLPTNFTELYAELRGDAPGPRLHDAIVDAPGGRRRRVLAVVALERLGARCVTLHFTRLLALHRAVLYRAGEGEGDAPLEARGNAVLDRRCPAEGTAVYAVDDRDQEEWLLRVYAMPDAATPTAAPAADDEAPRRGRRRRHRRR